MCAEAGLTGVFIGIETPNTDSLKEARKHQNLHVDLRAQVERFLHYGIVVSAGMIIGFDADGTDVFERQYEFAMSSAVPVFTLVPLVAPEATPLHARIKEGRPADERCDPPKSPIAFEIAKGWMASKDPVRRSCGYGLVYELAKDKSDKRLTDDFFLGCVEKIGSTIAKEENRVRVGMGGALMSIGKRNKKLNAAAIKVAKAIGPIDFSDGDKKCEEMNVLKHLTSDYLRNKLGI